MKPSDMGGLIEENFMNQRHSLYFEGPPGIGKTAVVDQTAERLRKMTKAKNFVHRTIILSQYESVDLRGIPAVAIVNDEIGRTTVWNPPYDLSFPADAQGIVFLDELPNAAPDVQKAAQQLIHARRLGDLILPEKVIVVAAGNRTTDRAGANRMLSALANRFEHHSVEPDFNDWMKWALEHGRLDHMVVAFLNQFTQHFNAFDPTQSINATPRTWEKVSQVVGSRYEMERVFGLVGKGIGGEFLAFCKIWRDLPSRQDIYKDPQKVKLPTKADVRYAISMSLALAADKSNYKPSIEFMERMEREWQTQFVKAACMANSSLNELPDFMRWIRQNKDLLQVN